VPTVSVVIAKSAAVWGADQAGPRAALVTDGRRLWVVSNGRYGRSIAARAWELFTPGPAPEAMERVCHRVVSSYTSVGAPTVSDEPAGDVAERLAAELGMVAVELPEREPSRAAG
jgi:hypothetical protein